MKEEDFTVAEAKNAIKLCRSFGGRKAWDEYQEPLQEIIKGFGSLERFNNVLEVASEAFGMEMSEKQIEKAKKAEEKAANKK